jgi:hypothetical protein
MVKAVAKRLIKPEFAALLTAVAPDGTKPVIPALLSDKLAEVNEQLEAAGGCGNVVIPFANSVAILVMKKAPSRTRKHPPQVLHGDCTMGVFIARIAQDAPNGESVTYQIAGSAVAKAGIRIAVPA